MKKSIRLIITFAFLSMLTGCTKEDTRVSVEETALSVSETVVSEEKVASDELEKESDCLASFDSVEGFVDYITVKAKEKFNETGVAVEDNAVFLGSEYIIHATETLSENESSDFSETFFCYTGSDIKFVKGIFELGRQDDLILLYDCDYVDVSDMLSRIVAGECDDLHWNISNYSMLFEFDLYFFARSFDELIKIQEEKEAAKLKDIMEKAELREDMPFVSLLLSKEDRNDYASPISAVERMLPELKDYTKDSFFSEERIGHVFVTLDNEKEIVINTSILGKSPDGSPLYCVWPWGYVSDEIRQSKEKLYSVGPADLEKAHEYTYNNVYNDDADFDYFFITEIEGGGTELFGLTDFGGFIIQDGENIYPVNMNQDMNPPQYFVKNDFDGDGHPEYGLSLCDGRGTGYWVEALVIVDPDEADMVKIFDINDLVTYNGNIFSHIKSRADIENKAIAYSFDDGEGKTYEGTVSLSDYVTETFQPVKYTFGDQFSFTYADGKWKFSADGGVIWKEKENDRSDNWYERVIPDYEHPLYFSGEIQYKDGKFTYSNLVLSEDYR